MIRVDAYFVAFEREREFAVFRPTQFVVSLQVGPAPQPTIGDVWQALPLGDL